MNWNEHHEGWVESVRPIGGCVEVTLSLADGSLTRSRLAWEDADWLELRVGQIVPLPLLSAGDPGLAVAC